MKLQIVYFGNPILRKKCVPIPEVTAEIRTLAQNMIETMQECDGVGLAAPQINSDLRIFVCMIPPNAHPSINDNEWDNSEIVVFINPKILEYSDELWVRGEGCISIPQIYLPVERPVRVKVQATDLDGNLFERELIGISARCFLHENDHINGVLFIDRVHGKMRQQIEPQLRELKKRMSGSK